MPLRLPDRFFDSVVWVVDKLSNSMQHCFWIVFSECISFWRCETKKLYVPKHRVPWFECIAILDSSRLHKPLARQPWLTVCCAHQRFCICYFAKYQFPTLRNKTVLRSQTLGSMTRHLWFSDRRIPILAEFRKSNILFRHIDSEHFRVFFRPCRSLRIRAPLWKRHDS